MVAKFTHCNLVYTAHLPPSLEESANIPHVTAVLITHWLKANKNLIVLLNILQKFKIHGLTIKLKTFK